MAKWGFDGFVMSDWFVTGVGNEPYDVAKATCYASATGHVRGGMMSPCPTGCRILRRFFLPSIIRHMHPP